MNIRLHPTLGLNPRLMFCPRCGGETNEIALLGANNTVQDFRGNKRQLRDMEKVPGGLCDNCKTEVAEHRAIVAAGGVYWKCDGCNRAGVIKPSPFAEAVRKAHKLAAPAPCGIQFVSCEEHTA